MPDAIPLVAGTRYDVYVCQVPRRDPREETR
jgi:hypothetical protein